MAFLSKGTGGGGDFDPVPAGTRIARCISVVDLGFHEAPPWGSKHKVYIGFEVPDVRVEWKDKDGNHHEGPALIGSTYTNSIHKKSVLGQHLVNWRGRAFTEEQKEGFDLFTILDKPCMISVTHTVKGDRTYANVSGIMGLPTGTPVPDRETPLVGYSPQDPNRIGDFDKMPEWLQKKCRAGHSTAESASGQGPQPAEPQLAGGIHDDDFSDDIPF